MLLDNSTISFRSGFFNRWVTHQMTFRRELDAQELCAKPTCGRLLTSRCYPGKAQGPARTLSCYNISTSSSKRNTGSGHHLHAWHVWKTEKYRLKRSEWRLHSNDLYTFLGFNLKLGWKAQATPRGNGVHMGEEVERASLLGRNAILINAIIITVTVLYNVPTWTC